MHSVYRAALFVGAIAVFAPQGWGATLVNVFMTKGPSDNQCTAQPAVAGFTTADPEVWVYVLLNGAQVNDTLKIDWLDGAGNPFASTSFNPLTAAGNTCFDGHLNTASQPMALTTTGVWTAHGTLNGTDLFSLNFIVGTPPASGTVGPKVGTIGLFRLSGNLQLDPTMAAQNFSADVGVGAFVQTAPGVSSGLSLLPTTALTPVPPEGRCRAFVAGGDITTLTGGTAPPKTGSIGFLNGTGLDAGPSLTVTGPNGHATIAQAGAQTPGIYLGVLGGTLPIVLTPALPLYLAPGGYTVAGPGGKDVPAFTATTTLGASLSWSNPDQLATVTRSTPTTFNWTGGDPSQVTLIAALSSDQISQITAVVYCLAPAAAGTFAVPASLLAVLPPSDADGPNAVSPGFIAVGSVPAAGYQTFTAKGLDTGLLFNAALNVRTASLQ